MTDHLTTIPELQLAFQSGTLDEEDYCYLVRSLIYCHVSCITGPPLSIN